MAVELYIHLEMPLPLELQISPSIQSGPQTPTQSPSIQMVLQVLHQRQVTHLHLAVLKSHWPLLEQWQRLDISLQVGRPQLMAPR